MQIDYIKCINNYLDNIEILEPIATGIKPVLTPKIPLKAIVFDIYGTLVISASGDLDKAVISTENFTKALIEAGFDWNVPDFDNCAKKLLERFQNTVKEHQKQLKENGHPYPEVDIIKVWEECFNWAINEGWIVEEKETSIKLHTVIFEILSNSVWPMPGMNNFLEKLKKTNLPLGIVSNAQFYTPIIMNYFMTNKVIEDEFLIGFDKEISVFSYKLLRSKPDTYLFNELAGSLKKYCNLKPEEVLFVGNDMLKDVWTASQVGFKTALFAADKRSLRLRESDERTKNLKPDFVITELNQILELI